MIHLPAFDRMKSITADRPDVRPLETFNAWRPELIALSGGALATPFLLAAFCPSVFQLLSGYALDGASASAHPVATLITFLYGAAAIVAAFGVLFAVADEMEGGDGPTSGARNALFGIISVGGCAAVVTAIAG